MAVSIYDSSYFPKSYLNYLAQRRIGTGMPVRSEDIGAIAEAELNARYADASKRRALDIQETSVNNQYDLGMAKLGAERDIYDNLASNQKTASLLGTGITLLSGVPGTYSLGKEMGFWGTKTPAPTKETVAAIGSTEAYQPPPISGIGAGGEAGVAGTATEALNYVPSGGVEVAGEAFNYVPGVEGAGGETAAGSSVWGGYAPFVSGGLRAGIGLASGEEPVSAISHGAGTGLGAYGGANAGAAIGTAFAPGPGTAVGYVVGSILGAIGGDAAVGWIEDACIIVTACNGRDSREVEISREYRDEFMSPEEIRGYYMMAEQVAPYIHQSPSLKKIVKELLVDKLVDYGKYKLGITDSCPEDSEKVALSFLNDCKKLGEKVPSYIRVTGEEV